MRNSQHPEMMHSAEGGVKAKTQVPLPEYRRDQVLRKLGRIFVLVD